MCNELEFASSLRCRICGNTSENRKCIVREMMYGSGESFSYFQCSRCECLQIQHPPQDMAKYYPDYYGPLTPPRTVESQSRNLLRQFLYVKRNEAALLNGGLLGKILCKAFPLDIKRVKENIPLEFGELKKMGVSLKSRVLDVGCGTGKLLRDLQIIGFEYLRGFDPFIKDDIEYAPGVKITKGDIHDSSEIFDFVMFHHSFEHVPDPQEALISVSRVLSEKGICLIRIPVVSSYAWKHYGVDWYQIDAPRHFFLHSIRSMQILVANAGLKIDKISYDSTGLQFIGSEQYRRGIPLMSEQSYWRSPRNSIFSTEDIKRYEDDARSLNRNNLGDQAAFYISLSHRSNTERVNGAVSWNEDEL